MMLGTWLKAQISVKKKKKQAFHLFKGVQTGFLDKEKNQAMVSPTKEYKSTISIQENSTA